MGKGSISSSRNKNVELIKVNELVTDVYVFGEKCGHIEMGGSEYTLEVNYTKSYMPKKDFSVANIEKYFLAAVRSRNWEVISAYVANKRGMKIIK